MKSSSIITVIKGYKGLFSSAAFSLIIHTLIFLINPTFSFITIDKLEDSKGKFLTVELINEEEPAREVAENARVQERSEEEEKVKNKKIDSVPATKSKSRVSAETPVGRLANVDKNVARPTTPAQDQVKVQEEQKVVATAKAEADRMEPSTELTTSLKSPSPEQSSVDLPSLEKEVSPVDKSEMREEVEDVPVRLPEADNIQPTESIAETEEEKRPVADSPVEKEVVDQLSVAGEKEVDVIPEPEIKKEGPVAEPEPPTPSPEQPAPVAGVTDVREAETVKVEPVPAGIVQTELPAAEYPKDLNVSEKKEEPVKNVEQKIETEEKREYMPDKKAEEMKVAEEREEPVKIIEQKVEPPAKKKKRIIPFRKMAGPEKETEIGIPMGRPFVKFTDPAKKVSSRVQSVSGRAQGKGVTRVTLSINGENTIIPVQNGHFLWDTVLRDGKNTISGTVWDADGNSATDTVAVEVLPSKNSFKLSIDEPAGDLESPVATVRGRVEDATVDTVRLILNGEFFEIAVEEDGYFEKTVLFKKRENVLQAEATNSAGLTVRTEPLRVLVKSLMVADILVHLVWNDTEVGLHPGLSMKGRSHLEDERAAGKNVNMVELMSATEGYGEKIFSVEKAGDGAYTLKVSGGRGTDCKLVVSLNSSRKVRVFKKRLLEGEEWVVGRFLMSEGVFWDEDEWFSGRIESSDSMIKYKSPEGVTWKELK